MDGCDGTQMKLMEENIAVVDEDDNVLRPASKRECHLSENITQANCELGHIILYLCKTLMDVNKPYVARVNGASD